MKSHLLYIPYDCAALAYAQNTLQSLGYSFIDHPSPDITHVLLPVPSKLSALGKQLAMLPKNVTIIGGRLNDPALSGYTTIDLLQSEEYLAKNAAITAHCAVKVTLPLLTSTLQDCSVLVIGWGRIGKCLAQLLRSMGARVTVAARKPSDRAILQALSFPTTAIPIATEESFRLIFNTVPAPISLRSRAMERCIKIELASSDGLSGDDIILARGLPGKEAPESSGQLIAHSIHQILNSKE